MAELSAAILLVEDEKNVGSTLSERLHQEGYATTWVTQASDARQEIRARKFNLVILDVGLPDGSGFDLARLIRDQQRHSAILFLTAFGNPEDRIKGLELGAEDYVVKPFHIKELLLRIHNILKRAQSLITETSQDGVVAGKATLYFSRFEAVVGEAIYPLTHKECALLQLLTSRRGQVISRDEILNHVWADDDYPTPRTVDNFIVKLRKLIEIDPENPTTIRSVRGVGYQLI